jgi:hypothetical protein
LGQWLLARAMCSPFSRPVLSRPGFGRAAARRSGAYYGSRLQFRRILSACLTTLPIPSTAGIREPSVTCLGKFSGRSPSLDVRRSGPRPGLPRVNSQKHWRWSGYGSSKPKLARSVPASGVKAVGVDDWAWRRGQRYGTILVDQETPAPVDLMRIAPPKASQLDCNRMLTRR